MKPKEILINCRALAVMKKNFSDDELEREILEKQINKHQSLLKDYFYSYLRELDKHNKAVEDCDNFVALFQEFPEMIRSAYGKTDGLVLRHCCRLYKDNPSFQPQIRELILKLKTAYHPAARSEKQYSTSFVQELAS